MHDFAYCTNEAGLSTPYLRQQNKKTASIKRESRRFVA